MISIWNYLNGKKTAIGLGLIAFSTLWVSVDEIIQRLDSWRQIIPAIAATFGAFISGGGVKHKVVKKIDKNNGGS